MQDVKRASHLKLVSDFTKEAYPYAHIVDLENYHDCYERKRTTDSLRGALEISNIQNYKLLDTPYGVELHLKSLADLARVELTLEDGPAVTHEFAQTHPDFDPRKLKRCVRLLQKFADQAGYHGVISFNTIRKKRQIILRSENKRDYFDFIDIADRAGVVSAYQKLGKNLD